MSAQHAKESGPGTPTLELNVAARLTHNPALFSAKSLPDRRSKPE
jgi:hypothetical protein